MRAPRFGWHVRAFRALVRAYPAWFRRRHAPEMEQLFLARLTRAGGPRRRAALWTRTLVDTLTNAPVLRWRHAIGPTPSPRAGGFDMLWHDVRYGIRHLVRTPVFTIGAVALLAVGIGANVAVFTVVDRVLFRSLPYERIEEVVLVYQDSDDGEPASTAFPAYRDIAAAPGVFAAVTATSASNASWNRAEGADDVVVEYTTSSYPDVVGRGVQRGRWFRAEEDVVGAPPAAVVSGPAWRARFGGDPGIVGQTVRLNGQPVTIVGVGPVGLSGSYPPAVTDFWLSISATVIGGQMRVANLDRREDHWYDVRARLAPGVSIESASAAMHALAVNLGETYPDLDRGRDITVRAATDVTLFESSGAPLVTAWIIAGILLLLAGANLANLLLVRGLARSSEVAVRRALGAGVARVGRLYLVESLILSISGGVAGLVLAHALLAAVQLAPVPMPLSASLDLGIDARISAFAVALMLAAGALFGLAPAVSAARGDITRALRDDRRQSVTGRGTARLRQALVIVQVTGSFLLVLVSGLLARSLLAMEHVDPGVDAERVAFIRTSPAGAGLAGAEAMQALEDVRARVAALPGVTAAAITSRLPAQGAGSTTTVVEGYQPSVGTEAVELDFAVVSPEYFETVGLALRAGRGFLATDVVGADRVVVMNEAAARRFWRGEAAVGRRLWPQGRSDVVRTVVGIVEDAPVDRVSERATPPMMYFPAGQANVGSAYIVARTTGGAEVALAPMRTAMADVRASLPLAAQGTLAGHFGDALTLPRFLVQLVGAISILALALASLGIYAVVAFNVARRTGELGLRIALGAAPARVVRMVVGEATGAVAIGLAAGVGVAALAVPQLEAALFGVQPLDPLTFAVAMAVLTLVAAAAAWLPARRAAQADPAAALRA